MRTPAGYYPGDGLATAVHIYGMTYDWFKERELERIRSNSDFRFTASLYLLAGDKPAAPDLEAALTFVVAAQPADVPQHLRKDVSRLASGQRILQMTDGVLGSDFADALISYQEAGGSVEQDFSPAWAAGVVQRVMAAMPGATAHRQAA